MPLTSGSSKKVISGNIGELISSYKSKGSIGTSHPASIREARRQAIAIAYAKAGKPKKRKPKASEKDKKKAARLLVGKKLR